MCMCNLIQSKSESRQWLVQCVQHAEPTCQSCFCGSFCMIIESSGFTTAMSLAICCTASNPVQAFLFIYLCAHDLLAIPQMNHAPRRGIGRVFYVLLEATIPLSLDSVCRNSFKMPISRMLFTYVVFFGCDSKNRYLPCSKSCHVMFISGFKHWIHFFSPIIQL